MRHFLKVVGLVACASALPCRLFAQSTAAGGGEIAGIVRDSSGGLLVGVTVEATSPALIERSRTAESDSNGHYRIVGLRPGVYTVSFTLQGFSTRRIDVEVESTSVVPLSPDMEAGQFTEEVTVTAEPPVVDVRRTANQFVISQRLFDSMPISRFPNTLPTLLPYVSCGARGGQIGFEFNQTCMAHGGRGDDQRITLDGLNVGAIHTPHISNFIPNAEAAQEIVIETAASGAEWQTGGVKVTQLPRDGGNTVSGSLFATAAFGGMHSRNLSPDLVDQGMAAADTLEKTLDVNPAL